MLLVAVVSVAIMVGSLAAVGLLPGQARDEPVSVRMTATTTSVPRRAASSAPNTTAPRAATTNPVLTSPSSTGPGGAGQTDAPRSPATSGRSPEPTSATNAPAGGAGTTVPFQLDPDDPTCQAISELLDMIDDPAVRSLIEAEAKNSGCVGG